MSKTHSQISNSEVNENQWKSMYLLGGLTTIVALTGILLDIVFGTITGGNLTALPQTAIDRFIQFHQNKLMGLYNLDLLNIIVQMILIPSYIALCVAHRNINRTYAVLALILYLFGSIVMVSNNTALPMLDLSNSYFSTDIESQRTLYAAAGEAMLAQGAHGSPGIFFGFFIPNLANLIISIVMLKGRIFSRVNSWVGIVGSVLMMLYVILVNFGSGVESMATAFAMPGGLLLMTWMIMYTVKLLRLTNK